MAASREKHGFSGILSQSIVVCLLAVFIVIALFAMFFTVEVADEIGWIGMTVKCLDIEKAAALGIPNDVGGVVVGEVDGIAQKAGIRNGDVLLGINGRPVQDMADFSKLVGKTDLSRGAQLDVIRRGVRIPVRVGPPVAPDRTAAGGTVSPPVLPQRMWDRRSLGIDAETFGAGEGRELGIPAGVQGVLVDGVVRGSLAEQVGLVVNDVIVSVNGQKVDKTAALWTALAGLAGAGRIELGLYREGRLMSLALLAASLTAAGGFPDRMGGWGSGAGGSPICPGGRLMPVAQPTASGTFPGVSPGRMGGWGLGPGGCLVCPSCGTRVAHQRGVPCLTVPCPSCGTQMMRTQ